MTKSTSDHHSRLTSTVLMIGILLPALIAYAVLFHFMLPIPCEDDYNAVLQFSLEHLSQPTHSAQLLHLFASQHNEYKLIFEHTLYIADLALTHHLNLNFLQVFGDLFVLAILGVFWLAAFPPSESPLPARPDLRNRKLLLFLPVPLLLFSLNDWAVLNFTMSTLQNVPVHFFALLAFYLLTRSRDLPFAAALAALLGTFCSPNGFLLAPLGVFYLRQSRGNALKLWIKPALIWSSAFLLPAVAYLYHYTRIVPASPRHLFSKPLFALSFLGSSSPQKYLAAPFGLLLILLLVLAIRRNFYRVNPTLVLFAAFLGGTALLAAQARSGSGLLNSVSSRYQINSDLFLAVLYCALAAPLATASTPLLRSRPFILSLFAATCFWLFGLHLGVLGLANRNADIILGEQHYQADPQHTSPLFWSDRLIEHKMAAVEAQALRFTNRAVATGIYTVPTPAALAAAPRNLTPRSSLP